MPVPSGEILVASVEDAPLLARLHAACFEDAWSEQEFASLLGLPGTVALLERGDSSSGDWRGFALLRHVAGEAEILTIGVLPACRGNRLAEALLRAAVDLLIVQQVTELFIEVDELNQPAQALYRRFGFVECGRRRGYYQHRDGSRSDALAMRIVLPSQSLADR